MRSMLSEKAKDALSGIGMNIEAIRGFTEGMTFSQFESDLRTFYAVSRALEIISEASRRLPDDLKERHGDLPWRAIRDLGNLYRHRYDRVIAALVWDTALNQLQALHDVVVRELAGDGTDVRDDAGA